MAEKFSVGFKDELIRGLRFKQTSITKKFLTRNTHRDVQTGDEQHNFWF